MVSTPVEVETTSIAEQLFDEITQIAIEQNRSLDFGEIAAAFCPVCAQRRQRKAAAQRRWRARRALINSTTKPREAPLPEAPARARK
jgi:hypothetical protein